MFCRKCGANFPDDSAFCPKCGEKTIVDNMSTVTDHTPVQDELTTIKVPAKPTYKKLPKGCATAAIIFASIIVICVIAGIITSINTPTVSPYESATSATSEQETVFLSLLAECEAGEFKEITFDEGLDFDGARGYRVKTSLVTNLILYLNPDNTIYGIRYASKDLYADGKVVLKLSDIIVTDYEQSILQVSCEKAIKSLLKAPSTAKFPSYNGWDFWKEDGITFVKSYVDAQNSFGAQIRSEFQFKFKGEGIISLIFDGEEYIK